MTASLAAPTVAPATDRPTVLTLESAVRDLIVASAERAYPEESCGLLLGRRVGDQVRVEQVVRVPNATGEGRRDHYAIDPKLMLAWDRQADKHGQQIVGIVHSHPDAAPRPSRLDTERAWPTYVYLIVSVLGGKLVEAAAWSLDESTGKFEPVEVGD